MSHRKGRVTDKDTEKLSHGRESHGDIEALFPVRDKSDRDKETLSHGRGGESDRDKETLSHGRDGESDRDAESLSHGRGIQSDRDIETLSSGTDSVSGRDTETRPKVKSQTGTHTVSQQKSSGRQRHRRINSKRRYPEFLE